MRLKRDRFASEEVDAPQAVFCMTEECKPRGAGASTLWLWPIAGSGHAAHDILVNFNVECRETIIAIRWHPKRNEDCVA